jgi:hypothetical protein
VMSSRFLEAWEHFEAHAIALVRSQGSDMGICGGQCGTGRGFLQVLLTPPSTFPSRHIIEAVELQH